MSSQPEDAAYGAYQRGLYLAAYKEASARAAAGPDAAAETLLGEIYAQAPACRAARQSGGVVSKGHRPRSEQAAFSLAMMNLMGDGIPRDLKKAAQLLGSCREEGQRLGSLQSWPALSPGEAMPQDFTLAAKWFRQAADAQVADAQYAHSVLLRQGNGVPADKDAAPEDAWPPPPRRTM